jgi:hypothetical protein
LVSTYIVTLISLKKEILTHATIWMHLKATVLTETSQLQKS